LFGGNLPDLFFQTPTYTQNGTEKEQVGGGSGFLISSDGMIVTNRHVVSDKTAEYTVFLNNGKKYTANVLARDPVLDIAIIKINPAVGTIFPYLDLGDSDSLDVGQSVIAIGNALGEFKNTVSVGVVSGLSRSISASDNSGNSEQLSKVIQTDAAINPGNSGGPLLDLSGHVVGVNVAVAQGSESIGFSLPINSVKSAINSVMKTGKIVRPYVGIRYIPVTAELKAKNNLTVDYGILVQKGQTASELAVIPGSPADKAGILENDIILEINGQKIDQDKNFAYLIRGKNIGNSITLKILSKGIEKTVTLKLEQAPDNM
jgi:serine protease Do